VRVLGVVERAEHAVAVRVEPAAMRLDEAPERLLVALARRRSGGCHRRLRPAQAPKLIARAAMSLPSSRGQRSMTPASTHPVVHLELHTGNLPRALAFYTRLFDWRAERVAVGASSYLALALGGGEIDGGVVETDTDRALWLPYVRVTDVDRVTERARELGATVPLEPREGPAGWRSVVAPPAGGEIALWQPKRCD
jgi:predicted enzyme related to lactoylglutathione lyase